MLAHGAAVALQHVVPCFLHLPFLSTSPEDLQQESPSRNSLCLLLSPGLVVGRLPFPWGRAQGRTRTLLACPEGRTDQRKRDGGDTIRPRASPSFVRPAPLMSHKSAQIYALQPENLLLTFSGLRVTLSPLAHLTHHPPQGTGWTQRGQTEMSGSGWSLWVPSSQRFFVIL